MRGPGEAGTGVVTGTVSSCTGTHGAGHMYCKSCADPVCAVLLLLLLLAVAVQVALTAVVAGCRASCW
jgi:hypothetical protein